MDQQPVQARQDGHAIIAGFGLPGRAAAERFDAMGIPYCVVELNRSTVERCVKAGTPIIEGDVIHPETLERAGIHNAGILVIAIPDERAAVEATETAHRLNANVRIITRCHYTSKGIEARAKGASEVIIAEQVVAREMSEILGRLSPVAHASVS